MPFQPTPVAQIVATQDGKTADADAVQISNMECTALAVLPVRTTKVPLKKKIVETLRTKTMEEATAEFTQNKTAAEIALCEAKEMEAALEQQAEEARAEFKNAMVEVEAAITVEIEAAKEFRSLREKQGQAAHNARTELYEAQKKLCLIEQIGVNRAQMKAMDEVRKANAEKIKALAEACKAAKDQEAMAKKSIVEEKQRHKQDIEKALNAIQKGLDGSLVEQGDDAKIKRGAKRIASRDEGSSQPDGPKKLKPDELPSEEDCHHEPAPKEEPVNMHGGAEGESIDEVEFSETNKQASPSLGDAADAYNDAQQAGLMADESVLTEGEMGEVVVEAVGDLD